MQPNNPRTGKPWSLGDETADGKFYFKHQKGKPYCTDRETLRRLVVFQNLRTIRWRAKRDGVTFDLDPEYVLSIFPIDNRCPILGTRMEFGGSGSRVHNPSLDKISPAKGYVRGNVSWISMEANRMKSNATLEALKRLVAYVEAAEATN